MKNKKIIEIKITESRAKTFVICSKNAKRNPDIVREFSSAKRQGKIITA
jgi:hypothetical protein